MNNDILRRIALNVILAVVLFLPVWLLLQWLVATVVVGSDASTYWPSMLALYFVRLGPLLVVASLVQQVVLLAMPRTWSVKQQRVAIILSGLLIPIVLILFARGEPGLLIAPHILGSLIVALLVYGTVVIPPRPNTGG